MTLSELSHALDAELQRISAAAGRPVEIVGIHSVEPTADGRRSVYFDLSDSAAGHAGTLIAVVPAAIADQVLAAIVARAPAHSRTALAVAALKRATGVAD